MPHQPLDAKLGIPVTSRCQCRDSSNNISSPASFLAAQTIAYTQHLVGAPQAAVLQDYDLKNTHETVATKDHLARIARAYWKLRASRLLVQAVAAEVAVDTRCMLTSTARTTTLLRMSARNASYHALRSTSSRRTSDEPACSTHEAGT